MHQSPAVIAHDHVENEGRPDRVCPVQHPPSRRRARPQLKSSVLQVEQSGSMHDLSPHVRLGLDSRPRALPEHRNQVAVLDDECAAGMDVRAALPKQLVDILDIEMCERVANQREGVELARYLSAGDITENEPL